MAKNEKGNIDVNDRPTVVHPDGSISTVYSEGRTDSDGSVVNYPTVGDEGKMLSSDEAWGRYKASGKHLGKYTSIAAANKAAQSLHEDQAVKYGGKFEGIPGYDVGFGVPQVTRGSEKPDYKALAKTAIEYSRASQGAANALSQKPATQQLSELLMSLLPQIAPGQDHNAMIQQAQQRALQMQQERAGIAPPDPGQVGPAEVTQRGVGARHQMDPVVGTEIQMDPIVGSGEDIKTGGNVKMPKNLPKGTLNGKKLSKEGRAMLMDLMMHDQDVDPSELAPTAHPEQYVPGVKGHRSIPSTQADEKDPEAAI